MARSKAKNAEAQKKAKEAKQRKILLILAPVLLIAIGIQVPKLMKGKESGEGAATTAAESAPAESGAAPAAPAPAAAPAGAPIVAGGDVFGVGSARIVALSEVGDSEAPLDPEQHQLASFSRFVGSDPFVQLVDIKSEEDEQKADEEPAAGGDPTAAPVAGLEPTAAVIRTNGVDETIAVDGAFPASDPAFELVEVLDGKIKFGLVDGSFSSGVDTLELEVGESIVLVSQPDGFRYTIKLVSIPESGTTATAPAPAPAPAPTPPA